jgi:hypothetical protein
MVRLDDIVLVQLTPDERRFAQCYGKRAELGGASKFRSEQKRKELMSIDQFIGVGLGELAGNKHFFKTFYYYLGRDYRDKHHRNGDGGCDTPGYKIDYKTSRGVTSHLLSYHLAVRPAEWHEDHTYVFILVDTFGVTDVDQLVRTGAFGIYLVGWATTEMLPTETATSGTFKGAYILRANQLQPIGSLTKDMIKKSEVVCW